MTNLNMKHWAERGGGARGVESEGAQPRQRVRMREVEVAETFIIIIIIITIITIIILIIVTWAGVGPERGQAGHQGEAACKWIRWSWRE